MDGILLHLDGGQSYATRKPIRRERDHSCCYSGEYSQEDDRAELPRIRGGVQLLRAHDVLSEFASELYSWTSR